MKDFPPPPAGMPSGFLEMKKRGTRMEMGGGAWSLEHGVKMNEWSME